MTEDARISALLAAIAVAPGDPMLRRLLVESLESAGRWSEAIEHRRAMLRDGPGTPDDHVALARAYVAAGQRDVALVILERLETTHALTPDGLGLLGRLRPAAGAGVDPRPPDPEHQADATAAPPPPPAGVPARVPAAVRGHPVEDDRHLERPLVRFADVGGMEALKEQIRLKIIYPSQRADLYAAYGQHAGGGLLLYGPPGCGKTYLARATAGELGASFVAVGIADVLDMWLGNSEKNLHAIFETARRHAPTVLFFDEVDALAAKRSDFAHSAGRHVINQFLAELDGVATSNEGVLVLGATNAPWHVDPAFRRPGRFDEVLFVPPPDAEARREILALLLRSRPYRGVDLDGLVRATDGHSGADLKGIVDRATQSRLTDALRSGAIEPLETADLLRAARELPPTTVEWFATVRNYVLYANQSGLYDPVKPYLR